MLPGVFPYSKKNAIINYIWAVGQRFHILSITHSVSIRWSTGTWGLLKSSRGGWGGSPARGLWMGVSSQGVLGDQQRPAGSPETPQTRVHTGAALPSPPFCKDTDPGHHLSPFIFRK